MYDILMLLPKVTVGITDTAYRFTAQFCTVVDETIHSTENHFSIHKPHSTENHFLYPQISLNRISFSLSTNLTQQKIIFSIHKSHSTENHFLYPQISLNRISFSLSTNLTQQNIIFSIHKSHHTWVYRSFKMIWFFKALLVLTNQKICEWSDIQKHMHKSISTHFIYELKKEKKHKPWHPSI